jgi:beta-N-acetylhexosaminidase
VADVARQPPRAAIFGLAGTTPSAGERDLFAALPPLGFILFARNCTTPAQVRRLCDDLRALVGRADAPILIDQEGGRVQRLQPPAWRAAPPMARFADLAERDEAAAIEAAWLNGRLFAAELAGLGISVDCAPVLDVPQPGADPIIGDRACGRTPEQVALIGQALASGLLDGGVLPVIKHIPGHGRASVDSHLALPVVDAPRAELERIDFAPFAALARLPVAMTAHVVYTAIDPDRPATESRPVIADAIRGTIGFDGLLLSDDIGMHALSGSFAERAARALAAGCDVVLHCSGALDEMRDVAAACPPLSGAAAERTGRALALAGRAEPFDDVRARGRLDHLLAATAA